MKQCMKFVIFALLAWSVLDLQASTGDTFVVVVHQNNAVESMSRKEISDIFLKTNARFDSGGEAVPLDLEEASPVRAAFSKSVHNRSVKAVRWYWQKRRFAVGGSAPRQATSEINLLQFITTNELGIGYVSANTDIEAFPVKVITISD
jgi:ABC-type phosphate transport system substrate-binding protein